MPETLPDVVVVVGGVLSLVVGAFAAGGAWMAVKKALNGSAAKIEGTSSAVARLEKKMDRLIESDARQNERIRGLEEKSDAHHGWIRRVEDLARGGGQGGAQ